MRMMMVVVVKEIEREVMVVLMVVVVRMHMLPPMQVFHVMVMVVLLQYHVEVAGIYAGFFHSADFCFKACDRQALQCLVQHLRIGSQVQHCCHGHIAADAGIAFQIKFLLHSCYV